MGVNDTPFVELPSPPRSHTQSPEEADIHGNDLEGIGGDEHARAVQYRDDKIAQSKAHVDVILAPLKGDKDAYRTLLHKTLPISNLPPPYLDAP